MDKYEYRAKTEEMLTLASEGKFAKAETIADSIDWRRVRSASMLMSVSAIYEQRERYNDAREMLYIAYDRAKNSKNILYKLTDLAIKSGDLDDADDCYKAYSKIAEHDPNRLKLEYELARAKDLPLSQQIEILEKLKEQEYTEQCGLDLASLYSDAGMTDKCIEECDEMSLWFTDGVFVKQALMLKKQYTDLTPGQEHILERNYEEEEDLSEVSRAAKMLLDSETRARAIEDSREANGLIGKGKGILGDVFSSNDSSEPEESELAEPDQSYNMSARVMDVAQAGLDNTVIPGMSIAENLDMDIKDLMDENKDLGLPASLTADIQEEKDLDDTFVNEEPEHGDIIETQIDEYETLENDIDDLSVDEEINEETDEEPVEETYKEPVKKRIGLGAFFLNKKDPFYEDDSDIDDSDIPGIDEVELLDDSEENYVASDEYIAENIEFQPGEISEEDEEQTIQEENTETVQLESPELDEQVQEEIQEVVEASENSVNIQDSPILDDASKEKLERKLEKESKSVEAGINDESFYDALDLQSEIMAGLAMIDDEDVNSDSQESVAADKEAEMTEIDAGEITVEDEIMKENIPDIKEFIDEEPALADTPEETAAPEEIVAADESSDDSDGRFLMEERYSLQANQSAGKQAGLTEYERSVFSYLVPVRGMSEQISNALKAIQEADRQGTSKTGNLLVTGPSGCGKTKVAIGMVKSLQKEVKHKKGRVAVVNGSALNGKNIADIIKKLHGGAIVIEHAGELEKRTIKALANAMYHNTGELFVVLEGSREEIAKVISMDRAFALSFVAKIAVPKFVNDELVTFAQTYAKENGYRVQEMAILAIYNRIDMMQRDDHAVNIAEVAQIMDEAFEKSKKNSLKRTMTTLFNKKDDNSLTLLMEEDFE